MARSIFVLFSWLTILCGLCSLPGGLSHARDLGRRHIIVGTVLSANGDSVLIGANVVLTGRDRHTETDSLGQFTFDDVAPGSYSLRVTHVGYAPRVDEGRVEASTDTLFVSFRLTEAPAVMGNISVTSQTPLPRPDELVSQHVFDDHHLQTSPQFAEDVYRAVARIPGVSADDYSARFRVRGGEHDEVLVLLDGLELIEPFHVKDVEGGIMSIVDVAALEQASLLTGGFSAAYGNRKSAVFDLQSRRPPQNGARMSAGVSLLNARAMSEGTFLDRRGSWLVSARRGYAELI
ncbi:MAG: TonB-dependent receptor, partial [candidate division Zixibacteria bacterium]|nr:TonB-dependent receptor [candidate division Zixibacteria bacterium]